MEQETILKEILNALKAHGEQMDSRFEQMESEMKEGFGRVSRMETEMKEGFERMSRMDLEMKEGFERVSRMDLEMKEGFERVDNQLEHLGKKSNGLRADFHETQENVDYLLLKNAQHKENLTSKASKGEGLS